MPCQFRKIFLLVLVQISGDTASSTVNAGSLSDLSNLANTSLYGFEDYHGVDIGVVRAVRMWFSPLAGEIPIDLKIKDTDTKLGFAISRTEEVRNLKFYVTKATLESITNGNSLMLSKISIHRVSFTYHQLLKAMLIRLLQDRDSVICTRRQLQHPDS